MIGSRRGAWIWERCLDLGENLGLGKAMMAVQASPPNSYHCQTPITFGGPMNRAGPVSPATLNIAREREREPKGVHRVVI